MKNLPFRHASLPQHLTAEELQTFIRKVAVETFNDNQKRFFSADEISEMEHESSENGRAINRMKAMLQTVTQAIKKGIDEPLVIEIPVNVGTKKYDSFRRQNDDFVDKGYEEIEVPIYGIVNIREEKMEYFTLDGNIIAERTRNLSVKEQHQYLAAPGFRNKEKQSEPAGEGTDAEMYIQN